MVYVIQPASRIRTVRPDPARKLSANLYDILLLFVQWKTPDDGQRNSPKHVEFSSKISESGWFYYKKLSGVTGPKKGTKLCSQN